MSEPDRVPVLFVFGSFASVYRGITLKREQVNEGPTPIVPVKGGYTSRLETIADVLEGRIVYWFEDTDMSKANAVMDGARPENVRAMIDATRE